MHGNLATSLVIGQSFELSKCHALCYTSDLTPLAKSAAARRAYTAVVWAAPGSAKSRSPDDVVRDRQPAKPASLRFSLSF